MAKNDDSLTNSDGLTPEEFTDKLHRDIVQSPRVKATFSKCDSCEERPGTHTRFGVVLCPECKSALEEQESLRAQEEREEIARLIEGKTWQPSLAYTLYFSRLQLLRTNVISSEKIEDFQDSNIMPLINLLSDSEIERVFSLIKKQYIALKVTQDMRKIDRYRESQVITRQTKREKTREKSEREITKQKKNASRDKTLSKEERAKAKIIEGLIAMGVTEEDAKRIAEVKK